MSDMSFKVDCMIRNVTTRSSVGLFAPATSMLDGYQKAAEFIGRTKTGTGSLATKSPSKCG